ncbi:Flp pilus assembly protein CpaB [Alloalcanivorax marinus]|uniref:Flp pilus assembly protein CpaB n=1 Tax=Alloalcanivorax marinus TaxID=1177169 RepID=UPI001931684C|nr:Flp pilus assembly protein CpaB [Alloalcanivorax marinus]MBL7252058.1 Flp pilus assembly protein CpaB [Alloalcanivorax marinus]
MGSKLLYTLPALLLALLALILALVGLSREPEPTSAERSAPLAPAAGEEAAHEYWVVREPVEAGETLTADNLAVVSADSPITGALSADEAIAGQQVQSTVRAGELLAAHHLETGGSLPPSLPRGHRAIAIPVDNVTVAGGLLRPGDRVDVITAFRRSDKDAPVALVMLKRIEVLAVRGVMNNVDSDDDNNRRNDTVVLSVPEARVSALMLASSEGKLRLAVVGGQDEGPASQPTPEQGPAADDRRATSVAMNDTEDKAEPFYFEDFFPEPPKARAPAPRASPGRRVQVFEGAESRSTYVR